MAQWKYGLAGGPALTYDKYDQDTTLYYMMGGPFYRLDSTAAAAGWANIKAVSGVLEAAIKNVFGIAVADIKTVKGVAV